MSFCRNETGATAIEYGLIAAGISIAIIVAVTGLGSSADGASRRPANRTAMGLH
jgi:Flp pilus assembly pilin Flp